MDTPWTRAMVGPETELALTVAPVTAGAFVDEGITVVAHVAPERAPGRTGSRYRVILTIKDLGARAAGPLDVTARFDERGLCYHRVRTVTHSVAVLEPGTSVRIGSLAVLGLRRVRSAAAAVSRERALAGAA